MSGTKTIYIVDDDEDCRFLYKEAIEDIGLDVDVIEAENGSVFLNILSPNVVNAVILIDVNMPKLNGIETLEILKKDPSWSHIPSILVSTSQQHWLAKKAIKVGARKFIPKPENFAGYKTLIKEVFSYLS